jgi:rod shape determining protein RodA
MESLTLRYLPRIDWRIIPVIVVLMIISLLVVSSQTAGVDVVDESFWTPKTRSQLFRFLLGWIVYLFFAAFDYNKLREWTWILYLVMIVSLVGLFFTHSVQSVNRWYKIPGVPFALQPSEMAKLIVVFALAWFLERRKSRAADMPTALLCCLIVGIPFLLILKQPDLGTALVLGPIALVIFYFGGVNRKVLRSLILLAVLLFAVVFLFFLRIADHEKMRPYATKVIKEYQYERLNPNTHHQRASMTAMAIGGLTGTGWRKSQYSSRGWLPAAETDSVFAAFGEEFGFFGLLLTLAFFYALLYFGFQVSVVAKDDFGRLLSAGITVYLAMHIVTNVAMMAGFLPITGVPLVLITYGGSSVLATMAALGILQSVYSRRFMF